MHRERQHFIDSINAFIQSSKECLNNALEQLDWTKESIYSALHNKQLQTSGNVNKPGEKVSSSTDVGTSNAGQYWKSLPTPMQPLYTDLVESLAQAASNQKQDDNKSRAEVLAEMLKMERDSKRRRINYKNRVHTKHKSHIEIIREVLAEQMSTLTTAGLETTSFPSNETESKKVEPELIEIQFPSGNPHTAWRTILEQITQEKKSRKENSRDREHENLKIRHSNRTNDLDYSYKKKVKHDDKYSDRSNRKHDKYSEHDFERTRDDHDERHSRVHSNDRSHNKNEEKNYKSYKKSKYTEDDAPIKDKSYKKDRTDLYKETETDDAYRKEKKKKKKHKRDRSSSSSPKWHKSKKHKSSHKSH